MKQPLNFSVTAGKLLRFALPSIVMMVVLSLYTVVDGIFVARLVNTEAFSAVNITFPMSSVVIALGTMFGTGLVAVATKKIGEGDRHDANRIVTFVTACAVGLSVVIMALCLLFLKPLLGLLGANDAIKGYAYDYALPLVCFFPAAILQLLFQSLFIADGKQTLGLIVILSGGVANIGLDYLFIVPGGMGIGGAAIATGIGYCIPAIVGLIYFSCHRNGNIMFVRPRAAFRELGVSMWNGSSEMVGNLSMSVTTLLFNLMMMKALGEQGVAAIAAVLYLDFVLVSINLGYSLGVAPVIGYHYGAGDRQKLQKIHKLSLLFCIASGIVVTVFTVVFSDPLVSIFADKSSEVYRLAAAGLKIFALGYLLKGFNIYCSALFTALSDGLISAILSLARTLVFLVASMFALRAAFGIEGIWYAIPLAEVCTLAVSLFCVFRFGNKYGYLSPRVKSVGDRE